MDAYLADYLGTLFYERTLETMGYFKEHKERILQSLLSAVVSAGEAMKPLIDSGEKQKVRYLQFSYLLSAAKMGRLWLKLDLYDARHYADMRSDGGHWDYSEMFPYIDEDMGQLRSDLVKRFTRIMDYEISDIRLYYHTGVFKMMWATLMELGVEEGFAAALAGTSAAGVSMADVFEPNVSVLFGAYLDQSEVVAEIERQVG
jgi:hypothetical protein